MSALALPITRTPFHHICSGERQVPLHLYDEMRAGMIRIGMDDGSYA